MPDMGGRYDSADCDEVRKWRVIMSPKREHLWSLNGWFLLFVIVLDSGKCLVMW